MNRISTDCEAYHHKHYTSQTNIQHLNSTFILSGIASQWASEFDIEERNTTMLYEPSVATKIAKRAAGALNALAKVINNLEDPEQGFEAKCIIPEDLALLAGMFAAVHNAPGRPGIVETWKGPGFYRIALRCGASQSQDFDKLDDLWVEVVKTAEPAQ